MYELRKKRALQAAAVALLIALTAGCAQTDGGGLKSGSGNTDVATGGAHFKTADEETAKLGSTAKPGVFPREVKHSEGTTEIKTKPKRVVVLDTGELDDVLALGITPVGIPSTEGANSIPGYLADKVKKATSIGTIQQPNLEAIAALKPDLILGSKLRADKLYPQLAQIAPTVFSIRPGFPWKENLRLVAAATGDEDKAVSLLNDYQAEADKLRADIPGNPTISLLRFMPQKTRLYGNASLIGVILKDVGLARPKIQDIDELATEISSENLAQADGDWIFYTSYGTPEATGETAALAGPIWPTLTAVKDKHVQRVDDDVWYLGLGPIGAGKILKDLRSYLVTK
ncbi:MULTISPECIES: ABC transporter substrate-binding protein [Mycetocola]|uniref:Iron-siderophore ABC transporter substrate-binding protein n=1 Tax=Mycetocola lacteus TaxID=76637 RepID=A0A3L7AVR0_9MICO|nr:MULTISPECIES: iron-siderophore ABC transporter substrate-binding protein [Mycetocola]MCS4277271.1 iron complex transport system substrate-binding protein [Mycetocola sp. BIGb0189]RLP84075.1 iron-siderophore ABC transporter substrate-binding protein [Mycetocola lacteus]